MPSHIETAMQRWFREYIPDEDDTLGELLAHYHRRWRRAIPYGIDGAEAITLLIPLLPPLWRDWATSLVPQYVDTTWLEGIRYGDLSGFIATLSHRYFAHGDPPSPPYGELEGPAQGRELVVVPPPLEEPILMAPLPPADPISVSLESDDPEPMVFEPYSPGIERDPFAFVSLIPSPSADFPPWDLTPATTPLPLPPVESTQPIDSTESETQHVPSDPYPRVAPLPELGTLAFQTYMHPILYSPYRDAQEGGSRPARSDSDEEDPEEETPEMTVGYGWTQPLQRQTTADGVDTWIPIPETPVYTPIVDESDYDSPY
ncbi:proline-rich receptor-like protein kinase PERK14 [Salvia miltiorrhiza]|uniref:proline-rich receptor-like protein kinase PERK14 n=1 Tax=Salvia miltiorrhiza TaxID=226208 RepID=UPI0025ABECE8|nr:proline-rich receptor-like protein kinase PERK14 [Salvia miltiorrhiza]